MAKDDIVTTGVSMPRELHDQAIQTPAEEANKSARFRRLIELGLRVERALESEDLPTDMHPRDVESTLKTAFQAADWK